MNDVALNIRPRFGSVEHYHHFLLGFVTPLVLKMIENENANRTFYIRSCSILDRIVHELKFNNLVITDKIQLISMTRSGELPIETLDGYDTPNFYSRPVFDKVSSYLNLRLSDEIKSQSHHLQRAFDENQQCGSPTLKISLIDRGPPHEFYNSALSEVKTAGNQRRSVTNFNGLVSALNSKGFNALKFYLEEKPLSFQMALFQVSDIVIAQHGASLSNLIWAHDKLNVVEIIPPNSIRQFFAALSHCLDLKYFSVDQQETHGAVRTSKIMEVTHNICRGQIQW